MIKQLVKRLLQKTGCNVRIKGEILEAWRGGTKLTIAFPSEETAKDIVEHIVGMEGQAVVVPLFDGFTADEPKSEGITVLDRTELEDEIVQVLMGRKKARETVLAAFFAGSLDEELQEAMAKPIVEREEVVEIGSKTVEGFNYILDLVPYFVFGYHSVVELGEGEVHETKGVIGVNALTESPEVWTEDFERVDSLEYFDRKLEPKIDEREAFQIAQNEAMELGTMEKERVKETGSARVVEKKRIKPKKEDIQIEGGGLVYLPIWCVEGTKGVIIINACTGKILRENLYHS